jgi:quercetin dioxygenase-like cupin family protein
VTSAVRVVWPGEPNALYHSEGVQEGFLVLFGECKLIVEEEERALRQWDYFHCPADTRHVLSAQATRRVRFS